ncbi:hypothetical protein MOQ_004877 [Trypanosoma cruzi marinkellei]|uniref:Uncharacterized protein n=1 Tax=Trypanosoma cruzi marinkellei TaxID=85056 RepID=K2MVZ4_TRYCR|nr:hypothetical protein MOQ_004877 [Trypanosoma cruzi marinkellei]
MTFPFFFFFLLFLPSSFSLWPHWTEQGLKVQRKALMRLDSDDARSALRRRLRNVMRVIDETLLLHGRYASPNFFSGSANDAVEASGTFSPVPYASVEAEPSLEQQRRELQAEREDAQRRLEMLKRARERRGRRLDVTSDRLDTSGVLTVPSHSGEVDSQLQPQASLTPASASASSTPATLDIGLNRERREREEEMSRSPPRGAETHVAAMEEALRTHLSERRAEEESWLAELRTVRRSAMAARQKALADAQAQIKRTESERVAKLIQIGSDMKRAVAETQQRCVLTEEEIRAIEVHEEALAALRACTGIKAENTSPVRPPPPLPPPAVALLASSDVSSPPNGGASPKKIRSPSVDRDSSSSSTPSRGVVLASPVELVGTSPPSPCNSRNTVASSSKIDTSGKLSVAAEGITENRISSSLLPVSHSTISFPLTFNNGKKELPRTCTLTSSSRARPLLSPSVTLSPAKQPSLDPPVNSLLPSQALAALHKRGILADVLPSEGRKIPTLVQLSKDQREVLLLVERIIRDLDGLARKSSGCEFQVSVTSMQSQDKQRVQQFQREEGPTKKRQQKQQQQQLEKRGVGGGSTRRVREVHHFSLVDALLLYPLGRIGSGSTGNISCILCGAHARQLLMEFSCTLFAHDDASSYCIFFISRNPPHHTNGALGLPLSHRRRSIDPNGAALLVLRFRCRRDWIAFLIAVTDATTRLRQTPPLSYGRALWMLAARLWLKQRGHFVVSPPTKHHKISPFSALSFSPALKIKSVSSTSATSGARERGKSLRTASGRFAVPLSCDSYHNSEDLHEIGRVGSNNFFRGDGVLQNLHRHRFGVRPVADSNGSFSRHCSVSATSMEEGY